MLTRLDEVPEYLSRGWSFETFPSSEPAITTVGEWVEGTLTPRVGLFLWGGVGRGKTGLAVSAARRFLEVDPARTAFYGRVTTVREELSSETGTVLAAWLVSVDLLILDDLDFGWSLSSPGDRGSGLLTECLRTRLSKDLPVLLTAHVPPSVLAEDVDASLRAVVMDLTWSVVAVTDGPSLRTGRVW